MSVNTIPSHCVGNCSFSWEDSITPTLSSISPNAGSSGESLTLTGSGFGDDTSAVTMTSGDAECVITSCADTQIVCTLGQGMWVWAWKGWRGYSFSCDSEHQ